MCCWNSSREISGNLRILRLIQAVMARMAVSDYAKHINTDGKSLIGAVDSGRNSIAMTLLASLSSANTRCT